MRRKQFLQILNPNRFGFRKGLSFKTLKQIYSELIRWKYNYNRHKSNLKRRVQDGSIPLLGFENLLATKHKHNVRNIK